MKKLLIEMLFKWLKIPDFKQEVRVETRTVVLNSEPWTKDHAKALKEFMGTHVGKNLTTRCDIMEIQANSWAIQVPAGSHETLEYKAGIARGIQIAHEGLKHLANVADDPIDAFMPTDEELEEVLNNRLKNF